MIHTRSRHIFLYRRSLSQRLGLERIQDPQALATSILSNQRQEKAQAEPQFRADVVGGMHRISFLQGDFAMLGHALIWW